MPRSSGLTSGDLVVSSIRWPQGHEPIQLYELNSCGGAAVVVKTLGPMLYVCDMNDRWRARCIVLYAGRLYRTYPDWLMKL